jgi:hypothetical protein
MLRVLKVESRAGHELALVFSDGTSGTADLRPLLEENAFRALADERAFLEARVAHGAVEWPCGVGIATEALYALAHGLPRPTSVEEAEANNAVLVRRGLRKAIADAVNGCDVAGLLAAGAPASEYEPEIDDFVAQLDAGQAITLESVRATWAHGFEGTSWDEERGAELARRLAEISPFWAD